MPFGAEENWYQSGGAQGMGDPYLQLVGRQTDRGAEQQRNVGDAQAAHERQMGQIAHDAPKEAMDAYYRGAEENRANRDFDQVARLRDTQENRSQGDYEQQQRLRDAAEGRAQGTYGQQQKDWEHSNYEYDTSLKPAIDNRGTEERQYRDARLTADPKTGKTAYQHGLDNEMQASDLGITGQKLGIENTRGQISARSANEKRIAEDRLRNQFSIEADALSKLPEGPEKQAKIASMQSRYGKIDPGFIDTMTGKAQYDTNSQRTQLANQNNMLDLADDRYREARSRAHGLMEEIDDGDKIATAPDRYNQAGKFFASSGVGSRADSVLHETASTLRKHGNEDLAQHVEESWGPFAGSKDQRMKEAAVEYYKNLDQKITAYMTSDDGSRFGNKDFTQALAAKQGEVRQKLQTLSAGGSVGPIDLTGGGNVASAAPKWDQPSGGLAGNAANTGVAGNGSASNVNYAQAAQAAHRRGPPAPAAPPEKRGMSEEEISGYRQPGDSSPAQAVMRRYKDKHAQQVRHDPYGLMGGR